VAKRISEVDPEDVLAHTSLSVIYQKKGMVAEAEPKPAKHEYWGGRSSCVNKRSRPDTKCFADTSGERMLRCARHDKIS